MLNRRAIASRPARGLSLVELMVGITIGLFIVAAATMVSTTQLRDNRQLLLETQLQQDLRASADIIARELRRAGYVGNAETAVWNPSASTNIASTTQTLTITPGSQGAITYDYIRPAGADGPYGYWLDNGVIRVRLAANAPAQDLTDRNVMFVETLQVELTSSDPVRLECPNDCPLPAPPGEPANYCWPTIAVRELQISITGRAVSDPAVRRTIDSRVRLRNDAVTFHPSNPSASPACPG